MCSESWNAGWKRNYEKLWKLWKFSILQIDHHFYCMFDKKKKIKRKNQFLLLCCIVTTNYTYTHACRNITTRWRRADTGLYKNIPLTLLKGLCVRGSWRPKRTATYWPPTLLAITAFLSRSPGLLNRGHGDPASLGHGSHSSIFTPTNLTATAQSGVLRAPSAGCWFSLQHLLSNWSELPVAGVI